jgi:hypothetical protein
MKGSDPMLSVNPAGMDNIYFIKPLNPILGFLPTKIAKNAMTPQKRNPRAR